VHWRFKKNLPYIPAPLVYRDVYYMVRTGGIVTSLDPATGRLLKEGRSRDAMGEYYARRRWLPTTNCFSRAARAR